MLRAATVLALCSAHHATCHARGALPLTALSAVMVAVESAVCFTLQRGIKCTDRGGLQLQCILLCQFCTLCLPFRARKVAYTALCIQLHTKKYGCRRLRQGGDNWQRLGVLLCQSGGLPALVPYMSAFFRA